MTPLAAAAKILADLFGYLAARGVDAIIGKWVAMVTIAFQKSASDAARKRYEETMAELMLKLPSQYPEWQAWRDRVNGGQK